MTPLPLLPAFAVVLIIVDIVFVASWSGGLALLGALLLLEPLFLRGDGRARERWIERSMTPVGNLVRLPAAFGTLSRVRRYLLVLFGLFLVLRVVMLVLELGADEATRDGLVTAVRLYDTALVVTALLLVVLTEQLDRLGRVALLLAHRPTILLVTSFAVIIGIGALLLMLPIAVHNPKDLSFVDSLFTVTSAVCVTGLAANDFAAVYTDFGHAVTLVGIQLGGVGMMTIAALAATFGRGSLERHAGYSATFEARSLAELRTLVRTVVFYTFMIEALGTLVLWIHWSDAPWLGDKSALWHAAFHAISAFCNAGFSLFSDSLTRFQGDLLTQLVIIGLVLTGGIGFPVLRELSTRALSSFRKRVLKRQVPWRRTPVGMKVALTMSAVLLISGALAIGATEYNGELARLGPFEQGLNALFTSVISRSAGFNTIDIARFAPATLFIVLMLMFVGGSSGGTAGGIKTNTLAVLLATLRAELRGRDPELFGRAIDPRAIRRAVAVAALSLLFVALALLILTLLEPGKPFLSLAFETVSAFGTVGLTAGLTPGLGAAAKLLLTATMFVGRVGPLTIAYAVGRDGGGRRHRLASEDLMVG